jgi:hypothetical protein
MTHRIAVLPSLTATSLWAGGILSDFEAQTDPEQLKA